MVGSAASHLSTEFKASTSRLPTPGQGELCDETCLQSVPFRRARGRGASGLRRPVPARLPLSRPSVSLPSECVGGPVSWGVHQRAVSVRSAQQGGRRVGRQIIALKIVATVTTAVKTAMTMVRVRICRASSVWRRARAKWRRYPSSSRWYSGSSPLRLFAPGRCAGPEVVAGPDGPVREVRFGHGGCSRWWVCLPSAGIRKASDRGSGPSPDERVSPALDESCHA